MPQEKRPRLVAPPGSCDTHMHFYDPRFPVINKNAAAPPASVEAYRRLQQLLGLERVVAVQPNAYAADNRCMLESMAAIGPDARGVAVVERGVSDAELERLTRLGIRGIRFMVLGGHLGWDSLDELAARVHPFGWHVQLQLDGRELAEREAVLRRLPGELVIDHVGKFLEPVTIDHPGFRALLRLVETGRCWVKLSASYEVSKAGPARYEDVGALAKALVKAAPQRMLWASNWPHPSARDAPPDDADLLDLLLGWAPDEATRRCILVDNPAALYGF